MKRGVYPGSFDPLTNGHIDIIERGHKFFDKLYILVAKPFDKVPLFTVKERVKFIQEAVANLSLLNRDRIHVIGWPGLTIDFVKEYKVNCILRGVRSFIDFSREQTLANVNYELSSHCETLLLCCRPEFGNLSSKLVKEIVMHKGSVLKFVPKHIEEALVLKMEKLRSDKK